MKSDSTGGGVKSYNNTFIRTQWGGSKSLSNAGNLIKSKEAYSPDKSDSRQ